MTRRIQVLLQQSKTMLQLPPINSTSPIQCFTCRNLRFIMDEAGRCRRTDGKKWRCSKAVIPNQKYCEKHMHRGCRSRKHVETSVYARPNAHGPSADQSKSPTVEDNSKEGSNGTVTKIVIKSANGTRVKDDDGSRAPQTNDTAAEREDSEPRRCRKPDKKRGQCGEDKKQCKKLMHGASKEASCGLPGS